MPNNKRYRKNPEDLAYVIVASSQILKMEKKRGNILKKIYIYILKDPSSKLKKNLKNLERKLTIANSG